MKKLMVILLVGCALVASHGFRKVAAADEGTPLRKLAGTYSALVHGSFFACSATCGSPGSTGVPLSVLDVGSITFDAKGNACAPLTSTASDSPLDASLPFVGVLYSVSKITSYDPATGTGEKSFTDYTGGQCHGAAFDSTGATVVDTGTEHFAVSDNGKRIDTLVTSLTDSVGDIGDFSISVTLLRQ